MLTVNGTELQKHQVRGPVGYTVVGSPTIVDGILSRTYYRYLSENNNWVCVNNALPTDSSNIEFVVKCKINSNATKNWQNLFATASSVGSNPKEQHFVGLICDKNGRLRFSPDHSYATENYIISTILQLDVWVYIKVTRIGTTYSLYTSTDGISYELKSQNNSEVLFPENSYITYGVCGALADTIMESSIDLNETYIKVNGKLWFYQPAETKYIVKDGKLVWADPRLALSGPVNYEVVGSPTITDGVASGFDGKTNYITTSSTFTSANSFETVIKIKFSALPDYRKYIFSKDGTLALLLRSNGKLAFHYGDYINGWITNNPNSIGTTILSIDTDYWVKLVYTGTTITLYLSTDGITYIQECSVSTTLFISSYAFNMGYSYSSTNTAFSTGSIDLNNTYIKVNDQLWFYGKNYATQNIAPVPAGYTYGNTTTPSIGYVDMRTQQFTAAPSGATIGRDE